MQEIVDIKSHNGSSEKVLTACDENAQRGSKKTVQSGRSSLSKNFWLVVVVACAVAAVRILSKDNVKHDQRDRAGTPHVSNVVVVNPSQPEEEKVEALRKKRDAELRLKLEGEKLKADIGVRYAKYKGDVAAIVEKYHKMLPLSEGDDHFRKAENGAAFIASKEGLCGFKACACLAYKIAYDWVKHTNLAEQAILPIVSAHVVDPITNAVNVYSRWTIEFRRELQAEDQAFSLDLALRSHKFRDDISVLDIPAATNLNVAIDTLVANVREHARDAAFAGVGVALEAAFIRSSYIAIRKIVVKIATVSLTSVAKKMVGTATSAATSAVADGPLPIGDIVGGVITVGGLTWVACDIYNVTKTMPDELEQGILKSVRETRQSLLDMATENLISERDSCLKSAESRVGTLNQLLR